MKDKKVPVYKAAAARPGSVALPEGLVSKINLPLLAQAVHVYQHRLHPGKTVRKGRSDVAGSRRKIYRQKGTGRARHGASSAPLFVGGGKAHPPKGLKRVRTLPKKMKERALRVALRVKLQDEKVVVADRIKTIKKTKDAQKLVDNIVSGQKLGKRGKIALFLAEDNEKKYQFFKNIKRLETHPFRNINAYLVYTGGLVVLDRESIIKPKKS